MISSISDVLKQRAIRVRPTDAIDKHIAKALGNSLRVQILWVLNERVACASELAKELGVTLSRISNHLKVLRDAKCVEVVESVVRGNSVQRFYRASTRIFFEDTQWRAVPSSVKAGLRAPLLDILTDDAIEAVVQGAYDSCEDAHMSWTPMLVDEEAQEDLVRVLKRTLDEVMAIQGSAAERLIAADALGTSFSVSILAYPSIGGKKKVEPEPKDAQRLIESAAQPKGEQRRTRKTKSEKKRS